MKSTYPVGGTVSAMTCMRAEQALHCAYARRYKLMATFPNTHDGCKAANAFMKEVPGASVLCCTDAVYIAHKDDMGEPVAKTIETLEKP